MRLVYSTAHPLAPLEGAPALMASATFQLPHGGHLIELGAQLDKRLAFRPLVGLPEAAAEAEDGANAEAGFTPLRSGLYLASDAPGLSDLVSRPSLLLTISR